MNETIRIMPVHEKAVMPKRASEKASGYDLCSVEEAVLQAGETKAVSTGLKMEIPDGYEVQVRPRSGLALKNSISVLNTPGTIDADFRGTVMVILHNFGSMPFRIETGARIAQMVIAKVEHLPLVPSSELSDTKRGVGGFGSTGVK